MTAYTDVMNALVGHQDLTHAEAASLMSEMMDGRLDARGQIGAFLTALAIKGETATELAAFAEVMRRFAVPVNVTNVVDTCGTGGSRLSTPNTSTMVAFVLAAAGVRVAKHGNRSSTGRCGSLDLLEAIDIPIDLDASKVERLIETESIGFMLAPKFHPAMKHAGPVRKTIGIRTVFNFLGPLANPARASRQVIGVSDPVRAARIAEALAILGTECALVVHGDDGLDELTLTGETTAYRVQEGRVAKMRIAPEHLGLARVAASAIEGGDCDTNCQIFDEIVSGRSTGAIHDLVVMNAAFALEVAGRSTVHEGVELAKSLLSSGAILAKVDAYRRAAKELQ